MKAIKQSPLSLTVPMVAFTPLFILMTSPLMLGELPNLGGVLGVLLIVAGSYVLNLGERQRGDLAPFRALMQERGPRLMLITAFLWSITANFDKIGVQSSLPVFLIFKEKGGEGTPGGGESDNVGSCVERLVIKMDHAFYEQSL